MQPMVSAGHGTWHGHCHSTGLPHVLGQESCTKSWWRECNCYLAGHPEHGIPDPGCSGSCQARQKTLLDILEEDAGLQQGCFVFGKGCLWLPEGYFCPKGTAALLAVDGTLLKYGSAREGFKNWILAAHAGRKDDAVVIQQLFQQLVPG